MADDISAPDPNSGSNGSIDERDGLPEDFPHASRLEKAGVTSLAGLQEIESLEELTGIGPAYAEDIQEALEEFTESSAEKGGATTEKRPSPLSGNGEPDESELGPATQQPIDIPEGPLEETVSFETYPADTYEHDALGFSDEEVLDLLRNMLLQRR
ncbi:MAG: pyruvate dehydrogenase (acetyl-transferring) E1 component subunit alpha, partial [Salinibacter sp.]